MNRRNAIKNTSAILGMALSSSTLAGLMAGCKAEKKLNWVPQFFTEEEAKTVSSLVETILPTTETPGAIEVGVPEFIDDLIGNFWTSEKQNSFRENLVKVNEMSRTQQGNTYYNLKEENQIAVMEALVEEAQNSNNKNQTFFIQLKEITYAGYFSSEKIGEEILNYDPVPGTYIGDLPVKEVGNAWSL